MNWHRHPELLDRLAAEYALGTMHGGARRRFEAVMAQQASVAQAVARWDTRLAPMAAQLPPLAADEALWRRIEAGVQATAPRKAASFESTPTAAPGLRGWWQRLFAPVPAGALAFGLMLGLAMPTVFQLVQTPEDAAQLPESYVGVLATANGRQGLIVSSLRRGQTVDLKVIQPVPVPAGSVLFLWTIDAAGQAKPVGPLPPLTGGFVSLPLAQPAEAVFFTAVELAVSVEVAGAAPSAPALPFVYRGLCGKLWRVPAAPR
jgi:anti-sigma-K factor RskA